jgi:Na+/proline symporter
VFLNNNLNDEDMSFWISILLVVYFLVLWGVSYWTSKGADNQSFFRANQSAPWYVVAFGMIGTSLSGVTFISVPGTVGVVGWSYFQVVLGFFIGYFVVAYVLLPLYYRLNLTSIYRYLEYRLGFEAYQWGAGFFILSRTLGATVRLFLVINVLQLFVFDALNIPFAVTSCIVLLMILVYTFKGGVKTIVWTDTLQTTFMLLALVVCVFTLKSLMNNDWSTLIGDMKDGGMFNLWNTDFLHKKFFLKQVLGGAFITITMTGMDQEMMQKNISVRSLRDAQKNMIWFASILVLVNALFLFLGGLLSLYAAQHHLTLAPDNLFPEIVMGQFPQWVSIVFILGLISALFPSVDGAITALTSSFCIDIIGFQRKELGGEEAKMRIRKVVHLTFAVVFLILVFVFRAINEKSIIDLLFDIAGYTYGPLLGLFAFGILTKYQIHSRFVVWVLLTAPIVSFILDKYATDMLGGYKFGFELLIVNGALTFLGLWMIRTKERFVESR